MSAIIATMPYAAPDRTRGLAALVRDRAAERPDHAAFLLPALDGSIAETVSYAALLERVARYAAGLRADGYAPGDRVLLLAAPTAELYALALAVLAEGLTLTLVDGRATPRRLYDALTAAAPRAVVGSASALRWWPLVGALRRARRFVVDGPVPGTRPLSALPGPAAGFSPPPAADGLALASFTSGSTGAPRAIVRTHRVLRAQHLALGNAFPVAADDVNLPGFPMAVLHNLCSGTTTVLPPADLRAAATADPARVLAVVRGCGVTSLSGAPAFMRALARHALANDAPVVGIRHLAVGGGPVGRALARLLVRAFPNAEGHVVYGATEAEPMACAPLSDVIALEGRGFLVGRPRVEVRVAPDGELHVRGAHVVGDGWHHTGDRGRIDGEDRLWLLGRPGDALSPFAFEAEALAVDGVDEAGFVAHAAAPDGELAIAVASGQDTNAAVRAVIARLTRAGLEVPPIRVLGALPMDARHGSKVRRAALARVLEKRER